MGSSSSGATNLKSDRTKRLNSQAAREPGRGFSTPE
jgi:hypothetical protein